MKISPETSSDASPRKATFLSIATRLLTYSAVATLFVGSFYRYLRIVPGFGWVDNKHYLLLAPILVFVPYFFLKEKPLKLDFLVLLSAFTFSLTFAVAGALTTFREQSVLVAAYMMPIASYFLFRYAPPSEKWIVNSLFGFVIVGFILTLAEFVFSNYFPSFSFSFALPFQRFIYKTRGIWIIEMDRTIPFLGKVYGIWGNSGTPFATGALFAAFMLYGAALKRHRPSMKIQAASLMILSFFVFYLCGSKTAYLFGIMMLGIFYLGATPVAIGAIAVAGFGALLCYLYFQAGMNSMGGLLESEIIRSSIKSFAFFGNAFVQTEPRYWFYILFGQGGDSRLHAAEFEGGLDYLNQFLRVGIFNFALLVMILLVYVQSVLAIPDKEAKRVQLPGLFFVVTLILGGLHYAALFKYPSNIIAMALMGYSANCASRLRTNISFQT